MNKFDLAKIMKEQIPTTTNIPFMGQTIAIKPYLSVEERLAFVKSVTDSCIENPDYAFGSFDYVFRVALVQYYTDIKLDEIDSAEENNIVEKLIFYTDIIDVLCAHTKDNIRELHDHCMESIKYEMSFIRNPLSSILEMLHSFLSDMGESMGDLNFSDVKKVIDELSGIDEGKLAQAFCSFRKSE